MANSRLAVNNSPSQSITAQLTDSGDYCRTNTGVNAVGRCAQPIYQ